MEISNSGARLSRKGFIGCLPGRLDLGTNKALWKKLVFVTFAQSLQGGSSLSGGANHTVKIHRTSPSTQRKIQGVARLA